MNNIDVLLAHPLKHHLYPIIKESESRGIKLKYITTFYMSGVFSLLYPFIPSRLKKLLTGYKLDVDDNFVISPLIFKFKRIIYRDNLPKLYEQFDSYVASLLKSRNISPRLVHTLQNYMPRTQKTCVELGIPYVYDLIIDSCEEVYKLISERMYGLESADGIIFNKSEVWKKNNIIDSSLVLVPNARLAELISFKFGLSLERVNVIPYGVDLSRFSYTKSNEKNKKLVIVRANSVRKGLLEFIDFLEIVNEKYDSDVDFVIVGNIDENELIQERINSIKERLRSGITLKYGPVNYSNMKELMMKSYLLIMPTYREGMSLIILEAFASGTLVIASTYTGVDILKNDVNSLILDELSAENLFEKFRMAMSSEEQHNRLTLKANNDCLAFSANTYSQRIIDAYNKMLVS